MATNATSRKAYGNASAVSSDKKSALTVGLTINKVVIIIKT